MFGRSLSVIFPSNESRPRFVFQVRQLMPEQRDRATSLKDKAKVAEYIYIMITSYSSSTTYLNKGAPAAFCFHYLFGFDVIGNIS